MSSYRYKVGAEGKERCSSRRPVSSDPGSVWLGRSSRRWTARHPCDPSGSCSGSRLVWSGSWAGCRWWAASCWGSLQKPEDGGSRKQTDIHFHDRTSLVFLIAWIHICCVTCVSAAFSPWRRGRPQTGCWDSCLLADSSSAWDSPACWCSASSPWSYVCPVTARPGAGEEITTTQTMWQRIGLMILEYS